MHILGTLMLICLAGYSLGSCPPDEYPVGSECCPLCRRGSHFVNDCSMENHSSTKCSRCPNGTFQIGNNKEKQCSTCSCGAGLGLKVTESCSSTSDAVCEVLDGFFCSDSNGGGCRAAQRHRLSCSPGQYIGQRGTAYKDTECLHCTDGTFSNGTSSSCQNHTKCESVGLKLMRPGTDSTDSECGEHGAHTGLVAGIISGVIMVMALMALIIIAIIHMRNKREWRLTSKMETLSQEWSRGCCPTGIYSPAPTRDQQGHPTTTPAATMDDHDGDQSLGPAPPLKPPHNGSVSLPQHPEDKSDCPLQDRRRTEYSTEAGCCPTCPPGMFVSRHCTEFSTSCASCTEGTFQDGHNGREQCFSCKHCDAGLGLKVKKSCSSTSEAVCEVLDGFFCRDSNRGGCRAAQRHRLSCSPGHYIDQRGTADKDTECLHCTDGTFSNGTSTSCQNHTNVLQSFLIEADTVVNLWD
ncbi:unnamed protein product [Arctogadus glacialis]